MKYLTFFVLLIALLGASFLPIAPTVHAQSPGGTYTTPVSMDIPADWATYEDVNGNWWLRHPSNWTVDESSPGEVKFQLDPMNSVEIVMETESFPLPLDNWLALDLLAQGVVQSMAGDENMKMIEMGRWLRGVFGVFFVLEATEPQTGMTIPVTVVISKLSDTQTVRASFSVSNNQDKNTVGAVLASITPGRAPATTTGGGTTGQQVGGGGAFFGEPTSPAVSVPTPMVAGGPSFGPITFAEGVDAQNLPINPTNNFQAGVTAVYAIFNYSGMQDGMEYSANWYMSGNLVFTDTYIWDLGQQGSSASVILSNSNGFPEGQYRLELLIQDTLAQEGTFTVGAAGAQSGPVALATPDQPPQILTTPVQMPSPMATPEQIQLPTSMPTTPALPTSTPMPPPTPKPQGRSGQGKIVYTQFDGDVPSLWTINVDGSGDTRIPGADHASDPSWSPNGTTIVFVGWDGNPRGGSGIYTMDAGGGNVRQIWNQGTATYLDWSLPGRYVLLTSVVAGTGNKRLIVYDGKDGQWFDIGPGEQGSFSPDASRLVAKSCVGGDCGLYVMNRDGSNKWRLTTSGDDAMAAWSPAGDRIAYASQRDGNWDIWIINIDGSVNTRITEDPGIDALPVWLPDGSGIVFRSSRGGSWAIWIMNPDGSNPVKIVDSFAGNDWGRARLDVVN